MFDLYVVRPAGWRERARTFWREVRYGWCGHRDAVRVHRRGVWCFECPCGYVVPMIARTARERAGRRLGGV